MIPSPPDIIDTMPGAEGVQVWTWIEAVEITRHGTKAVPGMAGRWRVAMPLRSTLMLNGAPVLDANGQEVPCAVPDKYAKASKVDLADFIHHPEVADLVAAQRSVLYRILSGEIAPASAPSNVQAEAAAPQPAPARDYTGEGP